MFNKHLAVALWSHATLVAACCCLPVTHLRSQYDQRAGSVAVCASSSLTAPQATSVSHISLAIENVWLLARTASKVSVFRCYLKALCTSGCAQHFITGSDNRKCRKPRNTKSSLNAYQTGVISVLGGVLDSLLGGFSWNVPCPCSPTSANSQSNMANQQLWASLVR